MSVAIELGMPLTNAHRAFRSQNPTARNVARPHLALTAEPKPVTPPRRLDPASREQLVALLWKLPAHEISDVLEVLTAETLESTPPPTPANDATPDVSGVVAALTEAPEACSSDIVDVLFESMYELGSIDGGVEGARHCLDALARALPARAAYVHFCDLESRELVTVATSGREASSMLRARHPESDWPVLAAVFKRAPLVLGRRRRPRSRAPGTRWSARRGRPDRPVFVRGGAGARRMVDRAGSTFNERKAQPTCASTGPLRGGWGSSRPNLPPLAA